MAGAGRAADAGGVAPAEGEEPGVKASLASSDAVKELVEYLARRLVDDADAVRVETSIRDDATVLLLHVAPADRGKVIGRGGRIVRSLRTLVRASGGRAGTRLVLEIAE